MLYTRDNLCNNVDISANARIPYFDQLKRYLPRNVRIVAKAITCKQCTCCKRMIAFATMLTFLHLPGFHILINQNATYQEISALLQRLSRVNTMHAVYLWISFATLLIFLHLPGFHILINQSAYLPKNISIVAKAITCKHFTCCIHVTALATLTFLQMTGFHILINLNVSLQRNVSIVAKAITCKHCKCCIHVIADISAFPRIPYFDQPKTLVYQGMSALLQRLPRVNTIHAVYTR